jgi:hypothetical protein
MREISDEQVAGWVRGGTLHPCWHGCSANARIAPITENAAGRGT